MLITRAEKYSLPLQLHLLRLKSQAIEVAKNMSLANERPATCITCMQRFAELSNGQRAFPDLLIGNDQGDSNNSSSVSIL